MSASDLTVSTALASVKPSATPGIPTTVAGATKAAKDFEAVFINEMLNSMFEGVKTDGPFGGGPGEEIFRSLMLDKYSKTIADQGGFGLAATVKRQLIALQEKAG